MKFVPRAEWGAAYAQGNGPIPGPVLGVTCHWEGPHMGDFAHDRCAAKVRVIERFHATVRGWAGIAYNLVICPHGYVFEGRGAGIRSAANGTSSIGGNDQWYAVCYLGGVGDPFAAAGRAAMADAIAYLRGHGAGSRVNGHRDHHSTECPGDEIYAWAHSDQEDDMATPEEVWSETISAAGDRHAAVVLAQTWKMVAALTAAVEALAAGQSEIVQNAVKAALADAVVDVDVSVHDQTGA